MPGEVLLNDYATVLTSLVELSAGPGSPLAVADPAPASGPGVRSRFRVYDPATLVSEILLAELSAPTAWLIVARQVEDAGRFPARQWSPGAGVEAVLTAGGLAALAEPQNPDKTYVHEQAVPAADVLIAHGLDKFPAVSVVDSAGTQVGVRVEYVDANSLWVRTGAPFSFRAFLN